MTIETLIRKSFPDGLDYDNAAQLCLTLYCSSFLPDQFASQCTKENLPLIFSKLAADNFIRFTGADTSARYGANFHNPKDQGHWIEIIASIFKIGETKDSARSNILIQQLADNCPTGF